MVVGKGDNQTINLTFNKESVYNFVLPLSAAAEDLVQNKEMIVAAMQHSVPEIGNASSNIHLNANDPNQIIQDWLAGIVHPALQSFNTALKQ